MKKSHLKQIIKEEINKILNEIREPSDEEYSIASTFAASKNLKLNSVGVNEDGTINLSVDGPDGDDINYTIDSEGNIV